ncbi:MAG: winged helix-turn-helix domain-containing protein [Candidatus ainarchaeum sp.]|nr:winged helix-turn-helix domain-containing protein [Candidatus ainarchaeum sp.]
MDSKLVSYILRSKNRQRILDLLKDTEKTPSQLVKDTNMYLTHTHRTIRELKDKDLIKPTNPEDKIYTFYKVTPKGKKILSDVKKTKKDMILK